MYSLDKFDSAIIILDEPVTLEECTGTRHLQPCKDPDKSTINSRNSLRKIRSNMNNIQRTEKTNIQGSNLACNT